jgi:endonuclease/exonuclease/phosphatase (EEP) superfamily protein YafD
MQYLIVCLFFFGLLLFIRKKYFILIALLCLTINLREVLPWYLSFPQGAIGNNEAHQVRVLVANIYSAQNSNYRGAIALLRREEPDIAVFVEMNRDWVKQLEAVRDILPHSFAVANPSVSGVAIYSKIPIEKPSVRFFVQKTHPSLVGEFAIDGQRIALIATHLRTPIVRWKFEARNQQLEEILQYIPPIEQPLVVAGDLNTTMWSPYFRQFTRLSGLRDTRRGFGIEPTWPTHILSFAIPKPLRLLFSIPIDHCLVSPEIQVLQTRAGSDIGSDHLPLITDLAIAKPNSESIGKD